MIGLDVKQILTLLSLPKFVPFNDRLRCVALHIYLRGERPVKGQISKSLNSFFTQERMSNSVILNRGKKETLSVVRICKGAAKKYFPCSFKQIWHAMVPKN